MKILQYLFLLFLLFLLAFVVFVATQPATYEVTKTKEIKLPVAQVFEYVNDYSNWKDWQQFETEETVDYKFSTNTIGKKSYVKWNDALMNTIYAEKDSITQVYLKNDNKESLHWKFSKINEGTLIKVVIRGTLSFKEKIFSVLSGGITNYAGEAIENSLLKIEDYLVHEVGNYKITVHGLVRQMGRNYIEQKDSCAVKDFPKKSKALLKTMKEFIKNNNIKTLGEPFVIFKGTPFGKNIKYAMCVPVHDEIMTTPESEIQGNHFNEFLAIKATLKGDYSHMKKAWNKVKNYIATSKYAEDENSIYIGEYKKALPEVTIPSEWVTEIYIPVVMKSSRKKAQQDSTAVAKDSTK